MNSMIDEKIKNCLPCQACSDTTHPKPIIPSVLPTKKWKLVAIDFSSKTPSNDYVLVVIDEYSRYPILKFTSGLTTNQAMNALKEVFKVYGVPERIKSDNGPAFSSENFKKFALAYGFIHEKIIPEHPQSNSICERFMGNLNKQMRIAIVEGKNWKVNLNKFLRDYCATPHSTTGISPNELFEVDDKQVWPHLKQNITSDDLDKLARQNDRINKQKIAQYANKYQNTKTSDLKVGDTVLYRWKRSNKHQTPMDPNPYKIIDIKHSMITATRSNHKLVRDVERFKKVSSKLFMDSVESEAMVMSKTKVQPIMYPPIEPDLIDFENEINQPELNQTNNNELPVITNETDQNDRVVSERPAVGRPIGSTRKKLSINGLVPTHHYSLRTRTRRRIKFH